MSNAVNELCDSSLFFLETAYTDARQDLATYKINDY